MFFVSNKNSSTITRLTELKARISNKKNNAAKLFDHFDHIVTDNNKEMQLKEQLILIRNILQKQQNNINQ